MTNNRYHVVTDSKNTALLLSASSNKIVTSLVPKGRGKVSGLSYSALEKKTKLARQSLYVFVGRLKKNGVVKVSNRKNEDTLIQLAPGVTPAKSKYVG